MAKHKKEKSILMEIKLRDHQNLKNHLKPNDTMEVESVLNKRHSPAPFPIHSSSSCLLLLCDGIGKKIPVPLPSLLLCCHCPQQISSHPSLLLIPLLFE